MCHDATVRRLGAVAAVVAVLLGGACSVSSSYRASSSAEGAGASGPGPTGPEGSDCLELVRHATSATLSASSLTLAEDAWRERPASSTVTGGGAAVITYQAPDRFHIAPVQPVGGRRAPVEQIFIGPHAWQGSARAGWVAYHSRQPTDPLRWLRVPGSARRARWSEGACTFAATVSQGEVVGRVGLDGAGRIATLTMTLTSAGSTIQMGYRVTRVGSSPRVLAPRT